MEDIETNDIGQSLVDEFVDDNAIEWELKTRISREWRTIQEIVCILLLVGIVSINPDE